jgi:ABC-type maltose transport system permease subunit
MLRQFFRTLPIELEEAARIDGASRLGVLFKIILPLSLPALSQMDWLRRLSQHVEAGSRTVAGVS